MIDNRITGWSMARLLAFVLVAFAAIFAVVQVQQESKKRDHAIIVERRHVGDVFTSTLAQGALSGCVADNRLVYAQRSLLKDSLANARPTYAQLVKDGTFSQAQADRLLADAKKQVDQYLARIPYRDCAGSAERYIKLIRDRSLRDLRNAQVKNDAAAAAGVINSLEAKDERRRKRL